MLNLFRSETEIVAEQPARHVSASRKKLHWLINSSKDAERMIVDHDMAEAMMERNQDDEWRNRPHSEKGLLRYTRNMKRGWKYTGETIVFSKAGHLLNGQHRLMACIKSGCSFECLIAFGVDEDAFKFYDSGVARTAGHIFAIEEIPNYNSMSSATKLLYAYDNVPNWSGGNVDIESDEVLEYYHKNEALQKSHRFGPLIHRELRVGHRWSVFTHYICARKSRQLADEYFSRLASGASISSRSATYAVRKRLLSSALSSSEKLSDVHCAAFIIKGWNAVRENRGIGVLKWRTDQSPNESFPAAL